MQREIIKIEAQAYLVEESLESIKEALKHLEEIVWGKEAESKQAAEGGQEVSL